MVFKLIEAASERWRYVNGPHLVALVRAGAKFDKGVLIERPDEAETKVAARSIGTRRPQLLTIPQRRLAVLVIGGQGWALPLPST